MNIKEIYREELARLGVLNSFAATPENLKSFLSALDAAQIRTQTAFNELQQQLINKEQELSNKATAIVGLNNKIILQEASFADKQNEVDNLNALLEKNNQKNTVLQSNIQDLHQQLSDKDAALETLKSAPVTNATGPAAVSTINEEANKQILDLTAQIQSLHQALSSADASIANFKTTIQGLNEEIFRLKN